MSEAPVQTQAGLEAQPPLPVRRLHNFIYCPRLFYFQWVENIFQENADTVAGSHVHRNVDAPSRLDDAKELGLPEGAKLRSLRLESESLGLIGVVEIVEGARAVAASGSCPPPLKNDARCLYCSAYPICLPNESHWWSKAKKAAVTDNQLQFGFSGFSPPNEDAVRERILEALDFAAESGK